MSTTPFPPANKALFIALSGIGNLIMQAPTLERFKHTFLQCHTTLWVAPRGTRSLAEALPYIDAVIEAPLKTSLAQHAHTLHTLRQEHFDLACMLSPGQRWKGAAYMYAAGIPRRVAHTYPLRNNPTSSWLLTDMINEEPGIHDIDQNLRLLELLGITTPSITTTQYAFTPPTSHQHLATQLLSKWNLTITKPLIGIHAGSAADFTWKRWPLDNFANVARHLITKDNAYILIMGGPAETDLKQELKEKIGSRATIVDTDLLTTTALMKHYTLFISNDSGLMHLAASVGTPTLGLFGPTDEHLTGPRGPHSYILRAPNTDPIYQTERNENFGHDSHPTLHALTPASVIKKSEAILRQHLH